MVWGIAAYGRSHDNPTTRGNMGKMRTTIWLILFTFILHGSFSRASVAGGMARIAGGVEWSDMGLGELE